MSDTEQKLDPALRRLSWILIVGLVAALLDTTVVNVAINTLRGELHASVETVQWVNTGYLLAMGMVVPLSGWSMQRFGAKTMWLVALSVFLIGSVLSGASWDIDSLIAFRVLQGLGGGLMFPILQTVLVQASGGRNVGKLMATVGLPAVVVPILGPVVGGLIISNTDWRWIFFINVPICLVGLVLAWFGVPKSARQGGGRLDVLGLVLLSPALVALLYGLSQVSVRGGFGDPGVIIPLAVGAVLLVLFCVHALRTRTEPVVDLRLFRSRSFAVSSMLLFLSGLSLYSAMFLLPLYFQQVEGYSALRTGAWLALQGVGSLASRNAFGRLTDRIGPRPVVLIGSVLTAVAMLVFTQASPDTSTVVLGAALVVFGVGLGGATVAVMVGAYQGLRPAAIPHASSATRILQQVGGSFGTTVLALILAGELAGRGAADKAGAFDVTFWWSFGFVLLAVVLALLLPGRARSREPETAPAAN
ncbi:DHA2 family efflux MFS transporter permease subunit [Amycolatopsis pithecellobii]|uniref:DHA2 family efflux MFS transporter permease subunit n=1 Tax=Amycolatopsis pithecellobii TaxID=664692 RepID=A0A6N7ZAR0_9PSEU|nr:DHA2 family efflux MFS transporter permease subunit [Amycolatopsis pithecellobii]MTD58844.1 DHA2 family efflux MFS transporter permease subunit [Amycolatopsis pithecellobii]